MAADEWHSATNDMAIQQFDIAANKLGVDPNLAARLRQRVNAAEAGLAVERSYYTLDGKAGDLAKVRQNDRLVVSISGFNAIGGYHQVALLDLLPAGFEIDAMSDELRSKSGDVGKRPDAHLRGAIDQMPAADRGVGPDDQLGLPVRLMGKMPARARGETSDPVQLSHDGVGSEMEQVDVLAKIKMPDARVLLHDQASWKNPAEADTATGMN